MIYLKMTIANRANTMPSCNARFFSIYMYNDNKRIKLHMVRAQEKRSLSIYSHSVKNNMFIKYQWLATSCKRQSKWALATYKQL